MILERDTALMVRVRQGDARSFELLLENYRLPVIQFLYRMIQNSTAAEELSQDVFLRVYRSRESYQPRAKFRTWLFCIATNVGLTWIRDQRRNLAQFSLDDVPADGVRFDPRDHAASAEDAMIRRLRVREIRDAVHSLPERQRIAVLLHKYEEMDYVQIARTLHCSVPATKSLLFRAYETLRLRLNHLA